MGHHPLRFLRLCCSRGQDGWRSAVNGGGRSVLSLSVSVFTLLGKGIVGRLDGSGKRNELSYCKHDDLECQLVQLGLEDVEVDPYKGR